MNYKMCLGLDSNAGPPVFGSDHSDATSVQCKLCLINVFSDQTSGQSYKHFTLVNFNSRVILWGIFQSGTTLES